MARQRTAGPRPQEGGTIKGLTAFATVLSILLLILVAISFSRLSSVQNDVNDMRQKLESGLHGLEVSQNEFEKMKDRFVQQHEMADAMKLLVPRDKLLESTRTLVRQDEFTKGLGKLKNDITRFQEEGIKLSQQIADLKKELYSMRTQLAAAKAAGSGNAGTPSIGDTGPAETTAVKGKDTPDAAEAEEIGPRPDPEQEQRQDRRKNLEDRMSNLPAEQQEQIRKTMSDIREKMKSGEITREEARKLMREQMRKIFGGGNRNQ